MSEPGPTSAELRELVDRAAIRDVLDRYGRGLDRRDFDLVASCFTPDVISEYGGSALEPGRDAILRRIRSHTRHATTHLMGNMTIDLRGDEASAQTTTIAVLVTGPTEAPRVLIRGLRYDDHLVRRDGGWRIDRRVHAVDWMTEGPYLHPGTPVPDAPLPQLPGSSAAPA